MINYGTDLRIGSVVMSTAVNSETSRGRLC